MLEFAEPIIPSWDRWKENDRWRSWKLSMNSKIPQTNFWDTSFFASSGCSFFEKFSIKDTSLETAFKTTLIQPNYGSLS